MNASAFNPTAKASPESADWWRWTLDFCVGGEYKSARSPASYSNSFPIRTLRKWRSNHCSDQSPIIIGGCPRSGTTLTRIMLDAHPSIACGPESSLLAGRFLGRELARRYEVPLEEFERWCSSATDHAQLIELFFYHYSAKQGKTRWAEKTPSNIRHMDYIFRHFPKAKFVHVVRDGRDLVCSLRTHPKHRIVNGQSVPNNIRRPLRSCIQTWLRDTRTGMAWRGHPNYLELRYEDLVLKSEPTLRKLCDFIGEPWAPQMLAHHQQTKQNPQHFQSNVNAVQPVSESAIGRWKRDLTETEVRLFYRLAGTRLLQLDYC